jgi:hypothetical protein
MSSKTVKKLDKVLSCYVKDNIKQIVDISLQEIEQIDREGVERFYKKAKIRKMFYKIPKSLKKGLHYLVNKKLREVKT